jgi:hypothetical protein
MEPEVKIPVEPVLGRKYFQLKKYFDNFVEAVEKSGVDTSEYVVVVRLEPKGFGEVLEHNDDGTDGVVGQF